MVKKKGFTLIEILVVVSLFGIIAVIGSGSFFSLLRGSTKSKTVSAVKQNGDYALGVMERMIRNARYLEENSNEQTCELGMTRIKIKNPDGGSTEFSCDSSTISSNSGELISGGLTLSSCAFDCREDGDLDPDVVAISFTLLSGASVGHPEEGAVIDFKTTISLRNIPE
ncbi:MAG TPA: type II secretion system protein [Patescibacteria group bacterium]|nr:type II secretion system protein [Patescibacteria group bacterium]